MEKQKISMVLIMVLASLLFVYVLTDAAPVGNPAKPILEQHNKTPLKIGTEIDIVTERKLKFPNEDIKLKANWYMAKLSYTFFEKIDLYTLLGALDGEVREKDGINDLKYLPDTDFAWGLGTTFLLYKNERGLGIGLDTRYRQSEPDLKKIKFNGVTYEVTNGEGKFKEWQVACAVSLDLSKYTSQSEGLRCIPYIGVKYSDVRTRAKGSILGVEYTTEEVKSKKKVGPFVGADFYLGEPDGGPEFGLNLEGRFIDETAFTVSLNYKF